MGRFKTSSGIQQEGNESSILFNLFLGYTLHIYKYKSKEMGTDNTTSQTILPIQDNNPTFSPKTNVLMRRGDLC